MPDLFSDPTEPTPPPLITPTHPVGLFSTYSENPSGVFFAQLNEKEELILFLRQDFITNVPWIFATLLLLLVPFLIRIIAESPTFSFGVVPLRFTFLILSFYYLIVVGFAFANFVTWYYTIGLVTDKRAIDIDFYNISSISVGSANLVDIKDAKYTQNGFAQSFFDYGDIILLIEASGETFVFQRVPRPSQVAGIISKVIGETSK